MCLYRHITFPEMRCKSHHIMLMLFTLSMFLKVSVSVAQINDENLSATSFTLPAWISNFEQYSAEPPIIFGISDPGISAELAYNQAYCRALMLAKLMQGSNIGIFTTQFESMAENKRYQHLSNKSGKYLQFYRIQPCQNNTIPVLRLIDSTTTIYGEKILRFSMHPADSVEPDAIVPDITIDFMNMEFNAGEDYTKDSFYAFSSNSDTCTTDYRIYKTDEISAIESNFNGIKMNFPFDYYKYLPADKEQQSENLPAFNGSAKLYYGLWKAYLEALIMAFTDYYAQSAKLQTVQDTYNNKTLKMNQLTEKKNFTANLQALQLGQNILQLKLQFSEPDCN